MLISVIVPVYNTKSYLPTCLDSIINQTYKNIEVILVDDGSTDGSLNICKDYAKFDSRVLVVQGSHKGLAAARKLGVEQSRGEYCVFVDSDDWIAENMIESIVPLSDAGSTDIVCYSMRSVNGSIFTDWGNTIPEGTYEQQLENIYTKMMFDFEKGSPGIIQSLCTKLIKRSILWTSIENIDCRITMGEDAAVTYKALLIANKISVTNSCLYFYRTRIGSMCLSKDVEIFSKISFFQKYMQSVFSEYSNRYYLDRQLQAYLLLFIRKGMMDVFALKMRDLYHIPFHLPDIGKRVILYGAGNVGKSYYRQLKRIESIEIIAWIDKGLENQYVYSCRIDSPKVLNSIEYDVILIAIKDKNTALDIKKQLGKIVSKKQILWMEPQIYWWEKEMDI